MNSCHLSAGGCSVGCPRVGLQRRPPARGRTRVSFSFTIHDDDEERLRRMMPLPLVSATGRSLEKYDLFASQLRQRAVVHPSDPESTASPQSSSPLYLLSLLSLTIAFVVVLFFVARLLGRVKVSNPFSNVRLPNYRWLRGKGLAKGRLGLSGVELLPTSIKAVPSPSPGPRLGVFVESSNVGADKAAKDSGSPFDDVYLSRSSSLDTFPPFAYTSLDVNSQGSPAAASIQKRSPPRKKAFKFPFFSPDSRSRSATPSPPSHRRSKSLGHPDRDLAFLPSPLRFSGGAGASAPPTPTPQPLLIDFSASSSTGASDTDKDTAVLTSTSSDVGTHRYSPDATLGPLIPIPVPSPLPSPPASLADKPWVFDVEEADQSFSRTLIPIAGPSPNDVLPLIGQTAPSPVPPLPMTPALVPSSATPTPNTSTFPITPPGLESYVPQLTKNPFVSSPARPMSPPNPSFPTDARIELVSVGESSSTTEGKLVDLDVPPEADFGVARFPTLPVEQTVKHERLVDTDSESENSPEDQVTFTAKSAATTAPVVELPLYEQSRADELPKSLPGSPLPSVHKVLIDVSPPSPHFDKVLLPKDAPPMSTIDTWKWDDEDQFATAAAVASAWGLESGPGSVNGEERMDEVESVNETAAIVHDAEVLHDKFADIEGVNTRAGVMETKEGDAIQPTDNLDERWPALHDLDSEAPDKPTSVVHLSIDSFAEGQAPYNDVEADPVPPQDVYDSYDIHDAPLKDTGIDELRDAPESRISPSSLNTQDVSLPNNEPNVAGDGAAMLESLPVPFITLSLSAEHSEVADEFTSGPVPGEQTTEAVEDQLAEYPDPDLLPLPDSVPVSRSPSPVRSSVRLVDESDAAPSIKPDDPGEGASKHLPTPPASPPSATSRLPSNPASPLERSISGGSTGSAGISPTNAGSGSSDVPSASRPAWSVRAADAPALGIPAPPSRVRSTPNLRAKSQAILPALATAEQPKEDRVPVKNLVSSSELLGTEKGRQQDAEKTASAVDERPLEVSASLPGSFPGHSSVDPDEHTLSSSPSSSASTSTPSSSSASPISAASTSVLVAKPGGSSQSVSRIRRPRARSPLDIALAMQLRPGLGAGADPAWMVRFLMAMFGWFTLLLSGQGDFEAYMNDSNPRRDHNSFVVGAGTQ